MSYMPPPHPLSYLSRNLQLNMEPVVPLNFPEWSHTMDSWGHKMLDAVTGVAAMVAQGFNLPPNTFTDMMQVPRHTYRGRADTAQRKRPGCHRLHAHVCGTCEPPMSSSHLCTKSAPATCQWVSLSMASDGPPPAGAHRLGLQPFREARHRPRWVRLVLLSRTFLSFVCLWGDMHLYSLFFCSGEPPCRPLMHRCGGVS